MTKYRDSFAKLRNAVLADIKKIIDERGAVVFYDVEDGSTFIDLSI